MKNDLTNTMRASLAEIARKPGTPAKLLPGGVPTVQALMRRGLVEVQDVRWHTFKPSHEHRFMAGMHLDGCHFYETHGRCECGVTYRFSSERDLSNDDYAPVWMSEDCPRCQVLIEGARPKRDYVIARPGNFMEVFA